MPIGYVYMISSSTGNYVGSTTRKVNDRFCRHKYDSRNGTTTSSKIVLEGENLKIELLEEVEFIDGDYDLLRQEEQKWIDMTECVNVERAYTPDDWRPIFESEYNTMWSSTNYERKQEFNTIHNKKRKSLNGVKTNCSVCGSELCVRSLWRHMKIHN
jgi:hypothetical protein